MQAQVIYSVSGRVQHGKGLGKTVSMPTVNLALNRKMPLPPLGVYAARVFLGGATYIGVTNLGYRPTVDDERRITCETFILDFYGDLYDKDIRVDLLHFLRPTRKMQSLTEVHAQVERDAACAKALLTDR